MDKIVEKLKALGLTEEDLNGLQESFNEAVDARVKAESNLISERAEEYVAQRVDELVQAKSKKLDEEADQFIKIKTATIAKNASIALNEKTAEVEKACQDYISEYFEKAFAEKYEKELALMEESILAQLDRYLDYAIVEKISPDQIKQAAVNETFAPIIKGIQNLFEEQYVPLNVSGKKKIKEAQAHVAELEETLQKQINENMTLSDRAEKYAKRALIAEKTVGLSTEDAANVKKFFAEKSFATTKQDIDAYCGMLRESARRITEAREQAIRESKVPTKEYRSLVAESAAKRQPAKPAFVPKSITEDSTPDFVNERIKSHKESRERLDENTDAYLTSVARYCEM
jgi:hypothetical protein